MATDMIMGPVHPGEILLEEFLKPLSVSQYHLAKEIAVPGPPGQRDCPWSAADQRRYGFAAGAVLRYVGAVLDQPAVALRPRGRKGPAGQCARQHPPAHGRELTAGQGVPGSQRATPSERSN
jgi:hypothetical protein